MPHSPPGTPLHPQHPPQNTHSRKKNSHEVHGKISDTAAKAHAQKQSGHRKSSIPFSNRAPRVRFKRDEEQHKDDEHGPFEPKISFEAPVHPIIKKTEDPIPIDRNSLQHLGSNFYDETSNGQLEACISYVEQVIQYFSKAEREARGSMDIMTFPVVTGTVEPLARFEGSMILAILSINQLKTIPERSSELENKLTDIIKIIEALIVCINKFNLTIKALMKRVKQRCQQWEKLLRRKGDFQPDENRHSVIPIYTKKTMPENVTMYENEIEDDPRFRVDGVTRIYRVSGDIIVLLDIRNEVVMKYPEEIGEEQLYLIAESVLEHARDLVTFSNEHLTLALNTLSAASLDADFQELTNTMNSIDFDAFFDPLCALELRNALGDVVSRKSELVNCAEHILNYFKWTENFTKRFQKYCKEVDLELKGKTEKKGCCSCSRSITAERLLEQVPSLCTRDFMISLPVTDRFLKLFFRMELPSTSRMIISQDQDP